jgi:hypothetical protein
MADDIKLPPGFTLDQPVKPPPGFTLDAPQKPAPTPTEGGGTLGALGRGALHGLADPFVGMAQIGARAAPPEEMGGLEQRESAIKGVDQFARERQQQFQADPRTKAHPTATAIGEFGGEVLSPPNLALAAVPGGGLARAAVTGAAAAGTEPVTSGDFWSGKAKQLLFGGGFGAAGQKLIQGAGAMIAPKMGDAAQKLTDAGVKLTPGQIGQAGGAVGQEVRQAESALKSFPILGGFIRNAEGRSLESFNRALADQALEPLGMTLPTGKNVGRDAVKYVADQYSAAYNKLLPNVVFQADHDFNNDIAQIHLDKLTLPDSQQRQLESILKQEIDDRIAKSGGMVDGRSFKETESELGRLAAQYRGSSAAGEREMSRLLTDAQFALRDGLARSNPAQATELKNINAGFALLARLEQASGRRLASGGLISPTDLMAAVKSGDKSRRKREFSHGDALWQDFAQAASDILPAKLPDSGTAARVFWGLPLHEKALGIGVGLPAGLAYKGATAAAPKLMQPGAAQQATRSYLQTIDPYVDPAFGLLGSGVAGR